MPEFSPGGRAHVILAACETAPASFSDMCAAQGLVGQGKHRRKLFLALRALRDAGFVRREGPERYIPTAAGQEALLRLRAGETVTTTEARPNARIFTRAAASPPTPALTGKETI